MTETMQFRHSCLADASGWAELKAEYVYSEGRLVDWRITQSPVCSGCGLGYITVQADARRTEEEA